MQLNSRFAIIVPFRDREKHLRKFKPYMEARFKNADIFVIEQAPGKAFNRGKLLNIGVIEAAGYDYYALHDVDMLPVQSDYSAPSMPTLLATKAQQFGYKMPFPEYFGGVVLIARDHILKCNGYHNEFWSWGAEDNSFRDRVLSVGLEIHSRDCTYNSLPHERKIDQQLYPKNCNLWKQGPQLENGISNCDYKIISREGNHIKVEI
jgi:hypothetical protein